MEIKWAYFGVVGRGLEPRPESRTMDYERLHEVAVMAIELMQAHNLFEAGWRFEWNNRRSNYGICRFNKKAICLSRFMASENPISETRNVILHEIAHALAGGGHHHDRVWKEKAIEIGCDGQRTYPTHIVQPPRNEYRATCVACATTFIRKRYRAPRRNRLCRLCRKTILVWRKTP